MASEVFLNEELYHLSELDLPCLVSYTEKTGGSYLTITAVADLFLRGSKILFLTAYPMAKDNFLEQIKGHEEKVLYLTDINQLDNNFQAIIIESGNEQLCLQVLEKLDDLAARVVLVKNMEVFSEKLLSTCLKMEKVILSGDIDKCLLKESIANKKFKTLIVFTKPKIDLAVKVPALEKYTGYLWNDKKSGLVTVKM